MGCILWCSHFVVIVLLVFSYDFFLLTSYLAAGLVSYAVVMPSPLNYTELLGEGTTFDGVVLGPTLVGSTPRDGGLLQVALSRPPSLVVLRSRSRHASLIIARACCTLCRWGSGVVPPSSQVSPSCTLHVMCDLCNTRLTSVVVPD